MVEIDPKDLRIDTFIPGGGGGFIAKHDAGVRLTHLPSGIAVEYSGDRSQHKNKAVALEKLRCILANLPVEPAQVDLPEATSAAPEVMDEREVMRLAAISTASFGYWKEGDDIHPDYDTVALRDVAKLYAKYVAASHASELVQTAELVAPSPQISDGEIYELAHSHTVWTATGWHFPDGVRLLEFVRDVRALLAQASKPAEPVAPELKQLMDFYAVDSVEELALQQARHIEKLQAKIPPLKDDQPTKPRFA